MSSRSALSTPCPALPHSSGRHRLALTAPDKAWSRGLRFAVTLLLLLIAIPAALQAEPMEEGNRALTEAQRLVYSQSGTSDRLEALFSAARAEYRLIESASLREYSLGRVALLEGTWLNTLDRSRAAAQVLEEAVERAHRALEEQEFSEGYRLLSDAHSQMMLARGLIYMIRNGDEARSAAFRALELDPANPRAHISVAGFYLNAPAVAGGDVEEGIEVLESGVRLREAAESERFLMYLWLSNAHRELGEEQAASRYLQQARSIFPQSPLVSG